MPGTFTYMQREIAFGAFKLDLANECLWKGARAISLRPKAFAVLKLLVDHPGVLVTKQQVLDAVWPGVFVGDATLKDSIRQLREALNDDAGSPTYIETAHRRGYRFIGRIAPAAARHSVPVTPGVSSSTAATAKAPFAAPVDPAGGTALLGRDVELKKLQAWLQRALEGQRQVVFITGEPGIGKSALGRAFLEQARQTPGLIVAQGQCLEQYGSGEAYLPVLDAFTRLCRNPEGAAVLNNLRQHAPSWLAQMPSIVPASEQSRSPAQTATRERMLREMAGLIEALTAETPLVLFLEDLHWSDYSTLDLVAYLARRRDPARLMLIGTYRPVDVIVGDHPLKGVKRELQAHRLCHEIPLEYLSEEAVADYLQARFPGRQVPGRLQKEIYRRTDGNPLFMINLIDYLADEKIISDDPSSGRMRVDFSAAGHGVPANLRQLIEKQLDRLNADERSVLDGASVAGMECSSAAIAAGLDMPVEWVEKQCEQLARRHQFLSPGWLAQMPDGTVTARHRFTHVLYQEVPYRLIPPVRRSQMHHRVAERGVVLYGIRDHEIAGELAMHFEQSRDWPNALKYLLQAAENDANRAAHHEAAGLAKRGLEILPSVPDTPERAQREIRLRMVLGIALTTIKGFASAEVEEVLSRGRELFWQQGPSPALFYMLWSLGLHYHFAGHMQSSFEISGMVLQMAEGLKDDSLIMDGHRYVGGVLVILGRCAEGIEHLEEAIRLYATHGGSAPRAFISRDCRVVCESFLGRALWMLGRCDEAAERMAQALAHARELGHPPTLVEAAYSKVQIHQFRGETSLVHDLAKEAVELADLYGLEFWVAYGTMFLGWAEAESGDRSRGLEQIERGLATYQATGARLWCAYFLGLLADQLDKAGRAEEALATVVKAIAEAETCGEILSLPELRRIKERIMGKQTSAHKSPA
ncbi:MAG TPA: AAA family ATPase [Candidatus Angelobacter sp.]|nr:AAA family ATPase [Candidatus Angelobacter sp.]